MEIVEGIRDLLFLIGVIFLFEYFIYEEIKIKLIVYDVKDKFYDIVWISVLLEYKDFLLEVGWSFLGYVSFKVGELLKLKE